MAVDYNRGAMASARSFDHTRDRGLSALTAIEPNGSSLREEMHAMKCIFAHTPRFVTRDAHSIRDHTIMAVVSQLLAQTVPAYWSAHAHQTPGGRYDGSGFPTAGVWQH